MAVQWTIIVNYYAIFPIVESCLICNHATAYYFHCLCFLALLFYGPYFMSELFLLKNESEITIIPGMSWTLDALSIINKLINLSLSMKYSPVSISVSLADNSSPKIWLYSVNLNQKGSKQLTMDTSEENTNNRPAMRRKPELNILWRHSPIISPGLLDLL